MGTPPPSPPIVTLSPHGTLIEYGSSSSQTFSASVTQPATITFYFDGVAQAPVYGESSSFSCINVATYHLIRVVASNENGSSEDCCDWWVFLDHNFANPPIVTRVNPADQQISNTINTSRPFEVSISQPAKVIVYFDDVTVWTSVEGIQLFSFALTATPLGTHIIRVVAVNSNGVGENYWMWLVILEGVACSPEGKTTCVGYDRYQCQNGSWILIQTNSPNCGYPSPLPTPTFDQACWEFMAKPGKHIYGLRYLVKMNNLPHKFTGSGFNYPGDAWFFVATHAYLFEDHGLQKGAIGRRIDRYDSGVHRFTTWGVYFGSTNSEYSLLCNEWREQRIELDTGFQTLKAYTADDSGNTVLLGESDNVTVSEILHVDFMAEIQYYGTMNLPSVALDENIVTLVSVKTRPIQDLEEWERPEDCLTLRTYSGDPSPNPRQGTWASITKKKEDYENPDGTWTFKFGITR